MEYESAFLIRSPEQIISKLSILLKKKCLLTARFGKNDDSFVTTILEVDIKNSLLIFYHSPKDESIEQLLNSQKITFKTEYLGIKVAFDATNLSNIQHQGMPLFAIPIPESILWIEARDFYRVKLPSPQPSYCRVTLGNLVSVTLKLYDISLIGFSMLTDGKEISDLMPLYALFEECKLTLSDISEGTISFEVRSKHVINSEEGNRIEKIGCKFTQITPAFENAIQHCMLQIERESQRELHWKTEGAISQR
jgi:flagellar brake protein